MNFELLARSILALDNVFDIYSKLFVSTNLSAYYFPFILTICELPPMILLILFLLIPLSTVQVQPSLGHTHNRNKSQQYLG